MNSSKRQNPYKVTVLINEVQGPTYYNSLESDIKQSYSLNSFKTKLKKKIMSIISFKNLIVITYLSSHA